MAVSTDGTKLLVANSGARPGSGGNTSNNTVTATITVSTSPHAVAELPSRARAYITNTASNSISVLDLNTLAVDETIVYSSVTAQPMGATAGPDGARVYVALRGSNQVSVIN